MSDEVKIKTVSILGCGWLGYPLALSLLQDYIVYGSSTTSEKLQQMSIDGIRPAYIKVSDIDFFQKSMSLTDNFWESSVYVISLPPRNVLKSLPSGELEKLYPRQIERVLKEIDQKHLTQVIFLSSTAVYDPLTGEVDESMALNPQKSNAKALFLAEEAVRRFSSRHLILRLGGLYGPKRELGGFFHNSKRRTKTLGINERVNLIHLDDAVRVITLCIEQNLANATFNVVSDRHPKKIDLYNEVARLGGLEAPAIELDLDNSAYKIVKNDALKQALGYSFVRELPLS